MFINELISSEKNGQLHFELDVGKIGMNVILVFRYFQTLENNYLNCSSKFSWQNHSQHQIIKFPVLEKKLYDIQKTAAIFTVLD